MVSQINLGGERAGMGGSGADNERCCEVSCEIDGLRARAQCGLEDEPPIARDASLTLAGQ